VAPAVLFRPQAEADVVEARAWYAAREADLGERFVGELVATIARIVEHPALFPRVHDETRRAVLRRFPYAVYFRHVGDTIVVLAVHGRQDPQRWRGRR
jgi:plasmid stabilization system protein ParE